jgi:hypothetical protein
MPNMELITSVTVGSGGAASVTLPATGTIPDTYTDLKVVMTRRITDSADQASYLSFNGSTSDFSGGVYLNGDGSSVTSGGLARFTGSVMGSSRTANTFGNSEIYIPDYRSTTTAKSYSVDSVTENNATLSYAGFYAGLWNPTTPVAITSITFTPGAGSWVEGSTFHLYGISKVTSTPKATGGIVSQDASYWYHTFPFTSTFTPTSAISCDYLVIAGGGGGGNGSAAGGGGAGGLRSTVGVTGGGGTLETALSLTAQAYTVTVGAGGSGGTTGSAGSTGSNSVFSTITSDGGGGGALSGGANAGLAGGSGGGGSYASAGGARTANQGFVGGTRGSIGDYDAGSGGGGAASAGAGYTTSPNLGGLGGNGVQNLTWANATFTGVTNGYYAGGGGGGWANTNGDGGTGGIGGGGTGGDGNGGGSTTPPTGGVVNTGGGGGGSGYSTTGGAGGSGLIIVRYAK